MKRVRLGFGEVKSPLGLAKEERVGFYALSMIIGYTLAAE